MLIKVKICEGSFSLKQIVKKKIFIINHVSQYLI